MKSELRNCSRLLVVLQLDSLQDECGAILFIDGAERIENEPGNARSPFTALRKTSFLTESISAGELGNEHQKCGP
jgi:hypothetical protein